MNKTEEKHELSCVEAPKSLSDKYTFQMAMFAFVYCRRIEGHWFEGWLQNPPFQVPTENKYINEMMQMRQAVQFSQILQSGIIKMCVCVFLCRSQRTTLHYPQECYAPLLIPPLISQNSLLCHVGLPASPRDYHVLFSLILRVQMPTAFSLGHWD